MTISWILFTITNIWFTIQTINELPETPKLVFGEWPAYQCRGILIEQPLLQFYLYYTEEKECGNAHMNMNLCLFKQTNWNGKREQVDTDAQ